MQPLASATPAATVMSAQLADRPSCLTMPWSSLSANPPHIETHGGRISLPPVGAVAAGVGAGVVVGSLVVWILISMAGLATPVGLKAFRLTRRGVVMVSAARVGAERPRARAAGRVAHAE